MRVALIRQQYTPFGGAERFVERALQALEGGGNEITLITRNWEGAHREGYCSVICNPRYARFPGGRTARDRSFALCVQQELASGRYDITQSHERIPGCMIFRAGDGVHAAWLAHRARTQGSGMRFLTRFSPYHRYVLAQEAAMLAHPALRAVICNSTLVRDEMQRYYGVPDDKLVIIENGIDLERFHPGLADMWRDKQREVFALPREAIVYLYVGGGFERKGVPRLLEAFAQVRQPHSHLFLLGQDRLLGAMQQRARQLGIAERTHFMGSQKDVLPFLGMADAFVLPTLYDPMPNAALEGMAAGLPTITSTTCGIAGRIREGVNGFVCDALDVAALGERMSALAAPGVAAGMRDAARKAVTDLSLDAMAKRLVALYDRVASTTPATPQPLPLAIP